MGRDVQRLAAVVPLIDEFGLTYYRDEGGCRSIAYRAGAYSNLAGTQCDFVPDAGIPFTPLATADFERIRRSLAVTGVGVIRIYVIDAYEPETGGSNRQIVFDLLERTPEQWAYVYEPGSTALSNIGGDTYAEIGADWFFMAWIPGQG